MRCRDVRLVLAAYVAEGRRLLGALETLPLPAAPQGFAQGVLLRLARTGRPGAAPRPLEVAYFTLETSLGEALVAYTDEGVVRLALDARDEGAVAHELEARFGVTPRHREPPRRLREALVAHVESAGRTARPRVSLARLAPFQRLVLEVVQEIGRGAVRPYWWVAREVGRPQASRAVGAALAGNPVPLLVPCHRVVAADGSLGGYVLGEAMKARLLAREGLTPADVAHSVTVLYGCRTTGIFCFPTCPHARRLRPENIVPFPSPRQAWEGGFRPCLVCRPA